IDEDDIEEMDIKWNMALLSMRADGFWKKTDKKITIQGSDLMMKFQQSLLSWPSQAQVQIIRGLSQVEARLVEFKENEVKFYERIRVLERDVEIRDNKIEYLKNELEQVKEEKESLDNKLTGFENASKDLENLLGSQRSDNNKEGLEYSAVPPPPAQIYSPPKKDLYWTGLPEFVDDTVTNYRRPTPSIDASKCNKSELQSSNSSVFEHGESTSSIMSKPMIKFVKEADCPRVVKINNTKNARKSTMKYAKMYMNISKGPKVDNGETWSKDNYTHKSMTPRAVLLKSGTTPTVIKKEKESLDNKLTGFENASKDLDNLLGSQRSDKNKEGLGYSVVPPPPAQIYSPPKKDLSWTGLLKFVDDTVTDYRRPTPSIDASKYNKSELQSSNFSIFEHKESTCSIISKPMITFVKESDCPRVIKINNIKNARKSTVKYAEMYRNISKGPKETRKKLLRPQLVRFKDLNKILLNKGNLQNNIDDKRYWDSGCS
nr:hypothetical protein [Tanacetum cinerariifolium]